MSFRSQPVAGGVTDGAVLEGDGTQPSLALKSVDWFDLGARAAGKNVLFAVHGFNVNMKSGACSLARLEQQLAMSPDTELFIGVLWPGDFWIPAVNYPFEGSVAIRCGQNLANRIKQYLSTAQSVSFVSHSLGARVVLETVKNLGVPAKMVCVMAGAINRDCLQSEYTAARQNARSVPVLASYNDMVLKLAFRVGDPIADWLHDDHRQFEAALGSSGPPYPVLTPIAAPWQIPNAPPYGHGDYLPSGDPSAPAAPAGAKWLAVADFVGKAFRGQSRVWPP